MSEVITGVVKPKDKSKSSLLARAKLRESQVLSFYFFQGSLRGGSFPSQRAASMKAWEYNEQG